MFNKKFSIGILLAMAILIAQVGVVAAAPPTQDTTPPTITGITTETDENGVTTVLVTLQAEGETPQTVRISLDYALQLGLIDPTTQEPVPLKNVPPDTTIDPAQVIEVVPEKEPAEENIHPIAAILANFFGEDPSVVNGYHEDGFGFGVIAQALWMSQNLTKTEDEAGDASLAEDILQAKRDKDYQAFFDTHPEYLENFDGNVPGNWGQFKKVLREKKNNLGVIVSGQAEDSLEDAAAQQNQVNDRNRHDKPKKEKKNKRH